MIFEMAALRSAITDERRWQALQQGNPSLAQGEPVAFRQVEPVYPDEWLDVALRQLARASVVPVISRLDHRQLLGVITSDDVRRAYGFEPHPSRPRPGSL